MSGQGQVVYAGTEKVAKKKVWYEGSDTLQGGHALCYNSDYGTAADADADRAWRAEKPAAGNMHRFAGVVTEKSAGQTGPGLIELYVPVRRGQAVPLFTNASCTLDTTDLYLVPGSYILQTSGAVRVAKAAQTVDRSSTNGTVLAVMYGPDAPRADDQEIGSTAHFTDAIWQNFPLADLRKHPHLGTLVEYDPAHNPTPLPPYANFADTNAPLETTARTTVAEGLQLVLAQAAAAENNACEVQIPGKIDIDGKPWAFEIEYDVAVVGDDDISTFVGLWEADTLDGDLMADASQALADVNFLGFQIKQDDGNAIDTVYRKDGQAQNDHQEGAGVPTANTAIRVAMYYNGTTIAVYVDGTAKTAIAAADIAAADFPSDVDMYLTFISKGGASCADGDDTSIRAFRAAQLA